MLGNTIDIDLYEPHHLSHINTPGITKADKARKVILLPGHGTTVANVGDVMQKVYNDVTRDAVQKELEVSEFSFVVPINLGSSIPDSRTPLKHEHGGHWVLAVFEPELTRENANGKIPYKMSFVDSMHDSKNNSHKSEAGVTIFKAVKAACIDLGDSFDDCSCKQQNDGWSCGYLVAENAVDLMSSNFSMTRKVRLHQEKDIFLENARKVLKEFSAQDALQAPYKALSDQNKAKVIKTPKIAASQKGITESPLAESLHTNHSETAAQTELKQLPSSVSFTATEPHFSSAGMIADPSLKILPENSVQTAKQGIKEGLVSKRNQPPLHYRGPIEYSENIQNLSTAKSHSVPDTALFASEDVVIMLGREGDVSKLFAEQRSYIERTVKQAEENGTAFKLVGEPTFDTKTGATIYTYSHPSVEPNKTTNQYNEDYCINYHVKDGNTDVVYGANVLDAIVFVMPDEKKMVGAKIMVTDNGVHEQFGDLRNKSLEIYQQPSKEQNLYRVSRLEEQRKLAKIDRGFSR